MCGIIGRIGSGNAIDHLLTGLENLEYRGYDSAGVAVQNGAGIEVQKGSGRVSDLEEQIDALEGRVGIGHTRWSTHGPPTDANAHPHTDSTEDVAVVHNGIIENYATLRERLVERGHDFSSDTDTEVIPHLVQENLDAGIDNESAFRRAVADLEGSYAIAVMIAGDHTIYAARSGSPLVVGVDDSAGEYYLASDVPAFLEYTDRVVYLEDGDVAVIGPDGARFTDLSGEPVARTHETVEWDPEQAGKGEYDHFMLKEIYEQPTSLAQAVEGRIDGGIDLDSFPPGTFEGVDRVQFVACGTSYHAALYGAVALNQAGVDARALLANEYGATSPPVDDRTLVVAVTQSGETADTLSALRRATRKGARTVTVTNVVGSTAAREADEDLLIRAGPEIGVAATKTFSSQAVVLTLLAGRIVEDVLADNGLDDLDSLLAAAGELSGDIERVLVESDAEGIASRYRDSRSYFFLGRGQGYPVALEGALKFKEITYEHAEGFASGELKHGPLALVTEETPVFTVFTGIEDEQTLKNAEEAGTRGAPVVAICPPDHPATDVADAHLDIPETDPRLAGLLANVQLQLLSYHAAELLDRPIDKPRNLAKSVTVE